MHFGVPVVAYDAGAVRETLHGGGILLREKRPEEVAELLGRLRPGESLREVVLGTQERAMSRIRSTDFGAVLLDRLRPVLDGELGPAGRAGP